MGFGFGYRVGGLRGFVEYRDSHNASLSPKNLINLQHHTMSPESQKEHVAGHRVAPECSGIGHWDILPYGVSLYLIDEYFPEAVKGRPGYNC